MSKCYLWRMRRKWGKQRTRRISLLIFLLISPLKTSERCKASGATLKGMTGLSIAFLSSLHLGWRSMSPVSISLLLNFRFSRFFFVNFCPFISLPARLSFHQPPSQLPTSSFILLFVTLSPSPPSISWVLHKSSCHIDWLNEGVEWEVWDITVCSSLLESQARSHSPPLFIDGSFFVIYSFNLRRQSATESVPTLIPSIWPKMEIRMN